MDDSAGATDETMEDTVDTAIETAADAPDVDATKGESGEGKKI